MAVDFDSIHPRLAGFGAYYAREIEDRLGEFESARREAIRRALPAALLGVAGAAASAAVYVLAEDWALLPGVITVLLFGWAWQIVARAKQKLKVFLAVKVCAFFDLSFRAEAKNFPLAWFGELALVPRHDRASIEDAINGEHEDVRIELADAHLQERVHSGKNTRYRTVFQGLLGAFSFPRPFRGRTVVVSDKGALFNWFEGFAAPGERVRLEDPRFESVFEVYSSDQVEARYLLTPSFMERLLALARRHGESRLRVAFESDRLLLALDRRVDSFEAGGMFESAADPARVRSLIADLALLFDLIETLGLALKTRS